MQRRYGWQRFDCNAVVELPTPRLPLLVAHAGAAGSAGSAGSEIADASKLAVDHHCHVVDTAVGARIHVPRGAC